MKLETGRNQTPPALVTLALRSLHDETEPKKSDSTLGREAETKTLTSSEPKPIDYSIQERYSQGFPMVKVVPSKETKQSTGRNDKKRIQSLRKGRTLSRQDEMRNSLDSGRTRSNFLEANRKRCDVKSRYW